MHNMQMESGGLKILVVEADRPSLEHSTRALRSLGHEVIPAGTANDGLALAHECAPDLTILDIVLPDFNGIELCRLIRERRDIPAIFLSASREPADVRAAMEQGAFAYLVKPVAPAQLAPTIAAAMSRAADLRRHRQAEANLSIALHSSRTVSVATGLLMERFGVTDDEALAKLKAVARAQRRKVAEISGEVVEAVNKVNGFYAEAMQANRGKRTGSG